MTDPVPMPPPRSLRIASEMGIEPSDPAFALLKAVEIMQRQSQHELSALVTKLADDVAASSALAEQAARAKAEQIVTAAGEWASGQILAAGHTAAREIADARLTRDADAMTRTDKLHFSPAWIALMIFGLGVWGLLLYVIF